MPTMLIRRTDYAFVSVVLCSSSHSSSCSASVRRRMWRCRVQGRGPATDFSRAEGTAESVEPGSRESTTASPGFPRDWSVPGRSSRQNAPESNS